MLSLLSLRLIPSFSARILRLQVAKTPSTYAQTRSFLTTTRWAFPAAKAKAAAKAAPKTKAKKATSTTTKAKAKPQTKAKAKPKARPKPKKAAPKKKKVTAKEEVVKFSKADLPPKRPVSPYIQFAAEYRKNHPKAFATLPDMQALMKDCGEAWKGMSDAEKQVYKDKYDTLKEEHVVKMAEWRDHIDPKVLRAINNRRVKRGIPRIKGKVIKSNRPATSFFNFLKELRDNNMESDQPAFVSRAAATWNALSKEEKDKYRPSPAKE